MTEKELRELFLQRLYVEWMLYKDSMLQKGKEDIFKASYKIEIFVNLYEILISYAEKLNSNTLRGLLNLDFGILGFLYQEWLHREDTFYEELSGYACSELEEVLKNSNADGRKDDGDGKGPDQAA